MTKQERASIRRPSETVDTSAADRELSKTRAEDSLLYDYNRDNHGLAVGEGFQFPLTSGPRTIVSCPSVCYVPLEATNASADPIDDPEYQALFNDTGACEAYPPCKNDEEADREADDICCERKFDQHEEGSVPIAYYWLIFVGTVVFLAWHLFLRHSQVLSASQINASTVSVGDFTVYVKGLGKNSHAREELTSFFAHYGEVATAVYTKNLGDFLLLEKKLMDLTVREAELARIVANEEEMDAGCWRGMWFWLYCRQLSRSLQNPKQAIETCQTKISEVRAEMETLQGRHLENTGEALITFNYEAHANNVFRDHVNRGLQGYLFCKSGDAPLFQDQRIFVYRAPEPSDMYWENMDFRGARLFVRRMVAHSSAIFILGIGATLQYVLEVEKEKARNQSIDAQTTELADEDTSSTLEKAKENFDLRGVSFVIAGVVVVMNMVITAAIKSLNEYEAYKTRSQKEMNFILKLTAGHLLNSVFVPIMVADPAYWYVRGGFVEQAFYIQLVNAVLPDIIQLIQLTSRVNIMYMSQFAKTQSQMDKLYAPQTFSIAERYSNILKTFGLSILFGPLLPCSYLIGLCLKSVPGLVGIPSSIPHGSAHCCRARI
ncbi:hypothetical protein CYMTET_26203 [Cymbomonas tetramitiformis]|uniref:CSC1/OSCA1-like cytosolic domain-containing protein n=1 Tax=Cymbomonas tetramitiformis TaxID=36881 RepID=A0AAE0FSC0_9CHLO|nr:hypothetical protein CYMTET_26203 [Cymbomonas tetramitiformis]